MYWFVVTVSGHFRCAKGEHVYIFLLVEFSNKDGFSSVRVDGGG